MEGCCSIDFSPSDICLLDITDTIQTDPIWLWSCFLTLKSDELEHLSNICCRYFKIKLDIQILSNFNFLLPKLLRPRLPGSPSPATPDPKRIRWWRRHRVEWMMTEWMKGDKEEGRNGWMDVIHECMNEYNNNNNIFRYKKKHVQHKYIVFFHMSVTTPPPYSTPSARPMIQLFCT